MRTILSSSGTAIQAFDQDEWARKGRYDTRDVNSSLELFRVLREANLALLHSLNAQYARNIGKRRWATINVSIAERQ